MYLIRIDKGCKNLLNGFKILRTKILSAKNDEELIKDIYKYFNNYIFQSHPFNVNDEDYIKLHIDLHDFQVLDGDKVYFDETSKRLFDLFNMMLLQNETVLLESISLYPSRYLKVPSKYVSVSIVDDFADEFEFVMCYNMYNSIIVEFYLYDNDSFFVFKNSGFVNTFIDFNSKIYVRAIVVDDRNIPKFKEMINNLK